MGWLRRLWARLTRHKPQPEVQALVYCTHPPHLRSPCLYRAKLKGQPPGWYYRCGATYCRAFVPC